MNSEKTDVSQDATSWEYREAHKTTLRRYRDYASRSEFRKSVFFGAVLLAAAWVVNFIAIYIATKHAGSAVTDIILSNIPVFDVDGYFVYGTFLVGGLGALILLSHPKQLPFALHTLALFILIRSGFTVMTHLGPPEAFYSSDFGVTITRAFFGADQFFSAHTGMPFLAALAFWHVPKLRYAFLVATLYFAVIVLMGHIHYTIDVMSAFFITYGIFEIAKWLFPDEWAMFFSEKQV
jgi:hypothetical protein